VVSEFSHQPPPSPPDASGDWASALRGPPTPSRDDALAKLHPLLLRAARFELSRRRDQLSDVGTAELDDLAHQAADDALIAILRKLDDFGGTSRFSTWAAKFALHEAGVKGRQRAWQNLCGWPGQGDDPGVGQTMPSTSVPSASTTRMRHG